MSMTCACDELLVFATIASPSWASCKLCLSSACSLQFSALEGISTQSARAVQVQDAFRDLHDVANQDVTDSDVHSVRRSLDRIVLLASQHGACCGCCLAFAHTPQPRRTPLSLTQSDEAHTRAEHVCANILKYDTNMALLVDMLDPNWYPESPKDDVLWCAAMAGGLSRCKYCNSAGSCSKNCVP
jgi:hypothetical protein